MNRTTTISTFNILFRISFSFLLHISYFPLFCCCEREKERKRWPSRQYFFEGQGRREVALLVPSVPSLPRQIVLIVASPLFPVSARVPHFRPGPLSSQWSSGLAPFSRGAVTKRPRPRLHHSRGWLLCFVWSNSNPLSSLQSCGPAMIARDGVPPRPHSQHPSAGHIVVYCCRPRVLRPTVPQRS